MRRVVFYSWQSDLPGRGNRNLIQDAIERAIRGIARDDHARLEPVLDRDTANMSGSPDIAQGILAKVASADVFVADVSIVNTIPGDLSNARPTRLSPNPNVLVEVGYAAAELGWENVILVQNSAFGGPESLPFDLRGRRVLTYSLASGEPPAEARGLLHGRLEEALRAALGPGGSRALPSGREAKLWWGVWRQQIGDSLGQRLFIREIGPSGFLFDLDVHSGAHSGGVTAFARILSQDLAYCRLGNGEGAPDGELVFRREASGGGRTIAIEEVSPCTYYRGMRAHFGGRLTRDYEPWFDAGFLNEIEMARIYSLLGPRLEQMRRCTGDIGAHDNHDPELPSARVYWGGQPGMYASVGSILMLDDDGRIWAAYTDDTHLRYFTNAPEYRSRLPATIEEWRRPFASMELVLCEVVAVVPQRQV